MRHHTRRAHAGAAVSPLVSVILPVILEHRDLAVSRPIQREKAAKIYDAFARTPATHERESGWTDPVSAARHRQYMQPLPATGREQNGKTSLRYPDTITSGLTGYRAVSGLKQAQLLASRQIRTKCSS